MTKVNENRKGIGTGKAAIEVGVSCPVVFNLSQHAIKQIDPVEKVSDEIGRVVGSKGTSICHAVGGRDMGAGDITVGRHKGSDKMHCC